MTVRSAGRPGALLACAALALGPLAEPIPALPTAAAVTPEEAAAAGYIPNPAPALARITIENITPDVLDGSRVGGTESGVPTVTVSGTVRNVGTVPLATVDVRLQRGPRIGGPDAVREPLTWSEPSFPVAGWFVRVGTDLAPGADLPYRVTLPATAVPGGTGPDLQITEPGVYPLLVNVNGTPEGGSAARLDDARTLLPVLTVPGAAGAAGPAATPTPTPPAVPLTLLWPLAAPPTRIAHPPGADGTDPVVVLTDDGLLRDLGEQGRLTGLVRAAREAFDGPGGAELREATCVAVDPDLLATASDLAAGQRVIMDPDGDTGTGDDDEVAVPDTARTSADASRWLEELRALTASGCVVTLPTAQADLDTVGLVGDADLTDRALDRAGAVRRTLGVEPLPDLVVPASGTLDPGTLAALGVPDATALVATTSTRTDTGVVPPPGKVGIAGGGRALAYPAELGAALAAAGEVPENPRYSDPRTRYWLDADSGAARLQDARAALLAPVVEAAQSVPTEPTSGQDPGDPATTPTPAPVDGQGVLAVPPPVLTLDRDSATALLETLTAQLLAGRMRAEPLSARLSAPVTVPDGSLAPDPTGARDPGAAGPRQVVDRLRAVLADLATLRSLVDTEAPRSETADEHLDPVLGDALRVLSESGRRAGGDGLDPATGTGRSALERSEHRLDRLDHAVDAGLAAVDLLPPGSVFTMASPNSPLLLVVRNALPFPVAVTVDVAAPPDVHVDPPGRVQVPAAGSRTLQVPTRSDAEGGQRRTITFALRGPDGRPLSEPVSLAVQSGGYPLAQAFALAAAALALVLGGRRYLRYRRGTPDPADEGHRP